MRYLALATDYDGTLAHDGRVADQTVQALERFRLSGRKVILVTGRIVSDLEQSFPRTELFDLVVAENGAVIFDPATRRATPLASALPASFIESLRSRGVEPLEVGDVIVASWDPQRYKILDALREAGLEIQMIFNKGAVMLLPAGVNKAFGLAAALKEIGLSPHNVVGVGDAENDHALLEFCACPVAVANALPSLKEKAALVTVAAHGAGVVELIDRILGDDLASVSLPRRRWKIDANRGGSRSTAEPI